MFSYNDKTVDVFQEPKLTDTLKLFVHFDDLSWPSGACRVPCEWEEVSAMPATGHFRISSLVC